MPACSAFRCRNRTSAPRKNTKQTVKEKGPKVTFHKFPKNAERRNAWIEAVRRVDWIPNQNSVLCSAHFSEEALDKTSLSCIRLRDNAVPSIFPSNLQVVHKNRESTILNEVPQINPVDNISEINPLENVTTVYHDEPLSISIALPDLSSSLTTLPPKTKSISRTISFSPLRRIHRSVLSSEGFFYHKMQQMKQRYQRKIKILQQSQRRHVKKIATLQNVLATLKNIFFINDEHINVLKNIPGPIADILKRQMMKSKAQSLT